MDRLHRYLSHGDSLWLWYVTVIELLRVEPGAVPIARSFESQAGVVVAGCGSDGNTPASLGLGKEAYYQSLDPQPDRQTDPCSSSPKKDTFEDHHHPKAPCPTPPVHLDAAYSKTLFVSNRAQRRKASSWQQQKY